MNWYAQVCVATATTTHRDMAADDTGRFLHADNKDSTIPPEREEPHFEAGVVPR